MLLLNSERVALRYGSYGIEILESNAKERLSSLYSGEGDSRTMRTLALAEYTAAEDPRVEFEQRRIQEGASIGAVFRDSGWLINKTSSKISSGQFDLATLPQIALMGIPLPASLAVHNYVFNIRQGDDEIDYATITEIHHPDYLSIDDLSGILSGTAVDLACCDNATTLAAPFRSVEYKR